jgi:hypothetical protein
VQFAVMEAAYWDREFVADLATQRLRLGETKMMRFRRNAAADEAWLLGHEFAVLLVA